MAIVSRVGVASQVQVEVVVSTSSSSASLKMSCDISRGSLERVPYDVVAPKMRRIVPEYEASGSGVVAVVIVLDPKRCVTLGKVP